MSGIHKIKNLNESGFVRQRLHRSVTFAFVSAQQMRNLSVSHQMNVSATCSHLAHILMDTFTD